MKKYLIITAIIFGSTLQSFGQKKQDKFSSGVYGYSNQVSILTINFEKGKSHNYPLMAIWLADEGGKYIQTLFVAESIGKGNFKRADRSTGKWQAGEIQRPAALPFWAHQRNILNENGTNMPTPNFPVPDAYTGATPPGSFTFHLITDQPLKGKYRIYLEINQSWDWNDFWHNNKYPEDRDYKTSSQPAVIYEALINSEVQGIPVEFKAIGRSHHSGKDGKLYNDLNTLSTALNIVGRCTVTVK